MDIIAQERDRLLRATARVVGASCTAIGALGAASSAAVHVDGLAAGLCCAAAAMASFIMLGRENSRIWTWAVVCFSLAAMALFIGFAPAGPQRATVATGLIPMASGALPVLIVVQRGRRALQTVVPLAGAVGVALLAWACGSVLTATVYRAVFGWAIALLVAHLIGRAMPRVARRIRVIGNAHRTERLASETEAQRRQGARLLHDTVLATLTLLAHSGVGVGQDVLRDQAAEDARLLRHLRLGSPTPSPACRPAPDAAAAPSAGAMTAPALGPTLESVQQRFGRMGLEVDWHGTGQVLLPSHVLDAFLLALSECLENVRRHAGVTQAHVTIVDDERTVRAVVTDAGVGFDITSIAPERLGFTESVLGRLREVGGDARLFSAPGSGTTVVLEAPR